MLVDIPLKAAVSELELLCRYLAKRHQPVQRVSVAADKNSGVQGMLDPS